MLTKFFILLFVPSKWEIIKEQKIAYKKLKEPQFGGWVYGGDPNNWSHHQGIKYTLQNQYGDLKFVTEMEY